jgi:hypothetical protein
VLDSAAVNCWGATVLEGGRLPISARTAGPDPQDLLFLSLDGGSSFLPRQRVTVTSPQDSCPTLASDGRAAYLLWTRADKSLGFVRAAQPGTTCRP